MEDSKRVRRGRFRVLEGAGARVVNPRTGMDDGKTAASVGDYAKTVGDPKQYAMLTHVDAWFTAALDAIAEGVGAAEVSAAYEPDQPGKQAEPGKMAAMRRFLEADERDFSTPGERLSALAKDYRLQGYCAIEVGRDSQGLPAAWYHVPAATLRQRMSDGNWEQLDYLNRVVATFGAYTPGGREDGLPELMVIRRYDPCALYLGSPGAAPLVSTLERLSQQDAYNIKLLRKGGVPPWLLVLKEQLGDEEYKRLTEWFRQLESGDDSDLVGVLDGVGEGADLKKLTEETADMAHAEAEKLLRERILAVLKVPPTKISLSASNYATAYQEDQTFKFGVLQPMLRIFLKRLSVIALELTQDPAYHFAFRQQSLEDYLQLAQAEQILLQAAVHTINEARARLGLPGIGPAGDVRIAFTNQGPIRLEDLAAGNTPPTPGRIVDSLLSLRRAIEEAQRVPDVRPAPAPAQE